MPTGSGFVYQGGVQILQTLTGTERVPIDNGGSVNVETTYQFGALSGNNSAYNTNSATAGMTLTAANVLGSFDAVFLNLTGALGGGANAQLPTVAAVAAATPAGIVAAGQGYTLVIINSSSNNFSWTVTTNTGWTLVNTMTVAQNTTRTFIINFTSPTAATLTSVGTGSYS